MTGDGRVVEETDEQPVKEKTSYTKYILVLVILALVVGVGLLLGLVVFKKDDEGFYLIFLKIGL